jgi:uncharacterized protein with NAD-binding domain and iron-sulfur cluster
LQRQKVAIIGGGCAAIAAAFELSRPEHKGKYEITVYQLGWRLGGKGASGRGPCDRIEEHGFHVWMGFYENAFRLMRECYAELDRDPKKYRIANWRDAFFPAPFIGLANQRHDGSYWNLISYFPPGDGLPGDPIIEHDSISISSYLARGAGALRSMLLAVQAQRSSRGRRFDTDQNRDARSSDQATNHVGGNPSELAERMTRLMRAGWLAATGGLIEAARLLEMAFAATVRGTWEGVVRQLLETMISSAHLQIEALVENDPELLLLWQAIDLILTSMRGILRFGLVSDPRGFDAINQYEFREWMRMNGASESTISSALVRGCYDLAFAYEDGDYQRPSFAAGVGLRGAIRLLFGYRGAIVWKMSAGMGDVVFAPIYELLKKRGVSFKFFHRLERVKLVDPSRLQPGERPYVEALEFDVQARTKDCLEYRPLTDVRGLPCWPSRPDYSQLVDGDQIKRDGWNFESHWDRRKVSTTTLRVTNDFDFVVLGIGIAAIPYSCQDFLERDQRWRDMVHHTKTSCTQAFQVWMREDMEALGWIDPPVSLSGFLQPFESFADMRHLAGAESWPTKPRSIVYFCSNLRDSATPPDDSDLAYPERRREEVRRNATQFLKQHIRDIWPKAVGPLGEFKWDLLLDPHQMSSADSESSDESRFDSQFWIANVDPTERYTLTVPGSQKYRISPLDNAYDNLTIAGDWTACGLDSGCVEAAVISGMLAAHAISSSPALEDIVGYDHP